MATFPRPNAFKQTILGLNLQNINLVGTTGQPFEIIIDSVDPTTGTVMIAVSYYSDVYSNFIQNESSALAISGIDYSFPITYPNKIYLETYYDKNLTPVYCKIKCNPTWTSSTIDPITKAIVKTYPNELEFITKYDLTNKITELNADNINNEQIRTSSLGEITNLINAGYYSQSEGAAETAIVNARYDTIKSALTTYINNFSQFFNGSGPLTKKLFKSITLLAYTTKDEYPGIKGHVVKPPIPLNQQTGTQTSTQDNSYRLIQCASTDFMVVDVYSNNLAAKTLVPWTRGVSKYTLSNGKSEEVSNTSS